MHSSASADVRYSADSDGGRPNLLLRLLLLCLSTEPSSTRIGGHRCAAVMGLPPGGVL